MGKQEINIQIIKATGSNGIVVAWLAGEVDQHIAPQDPPPHPPPGDQLVRADPPVMPQQDNQPD